MLLHCLLLWWWYCASWTTCRLGPSAGAVSLLWRFAYLDAGQLLAEQGDGGMVGLRPQDGIGARPQVAAQVRERRVHVVLVGDAQRDGQVLDHEAHGKTRIELARKHVLL